ncbi:MAG: MBL fold metallo-hydrolase [Desulfurococcaceae archaeon]
MVIVSWHGHACVSLKIDDYVIVIDPHDGSSIGIKRPEIKADMVLVTHDHFDHNAIDVVSKERTRVFKMFYGESVIDNVKVIGLKTYHDKQMGRRRGENAVYIVEARGFRIAHLGDLGEIPSKDVLDKLAKVDLLIVPVGGTFTIEPQEGWRIIEATSPLNVMPIHYWISGLTLPLKPIDEFLKYISNYNVVKLDTNTFNLRDYKKTVIVAKPPR